MLPPLCSDYGQVGINNTNTPIYYPVAVIGLNPAYTSVTVRVKQMGECV